MTVVWWVLGSLAAIIYVVAFVSGMEEMHTRNMRRSLGLCPWCGKAEHYGRACSG